MTSKFSTPELIDGEQIQKAAAVEFRRLCALTPKAFIDEIPRICTQLSVDVRAQDLTEKWQEAIRELAAAANRVEGADYIEPFFADEHPAAIHYAGGRYLRLLVAWVPPTIDDDGHDVPASWLARFDVRVSRRA